MGETRKGLHPLTKLIRERPYSARVRVINVLKDTRFTLTRACVVLGVSRRRMTQVIHELGLYEYLDARRQERHAIAERNRAALARPRWILNARIREQTPEGAEVHRARSRERMRRLRAAERDERVPPVGHVET